MTTDELKKMDEKFEELFGEGPDSAFRMLCNEIRAAMHRLERLKRVKDHDDEH